MDTYILLICLQGHVRGYLRYRSDRRTDENYCPECSEPLITDCPNCKRPITLGVDRSGYGGSEGVPSYCIKCKHTFPWKEKALEEARQAIRELDGLSETDKAALQESLTDVAVQSPRTEGAAKRIKELLAKGKGPANTFYEKFILPVAVEVVKQGLKPPGSP